MFWCTLRIVQPENRFHFFGIMQVSQKCKWKYSYSWEHAELDAFFTPLHPTTWWRQSIVLKPTAFDYHFSVFQYHSTSFLRIFLRRMSAVSASTPIVIHDLCEQSEVNYRRVRRGMIFVYLLIVVLFWSLVFWNVWLFFYVSLAAVNSCSSPDCQKWRNEVNIGSWM